MSCWKCGKKGNFAGQVCNECFKKMKSDKIIEGIKCKVCGGTLVIGDCATQCMSCGASVNPDTGEPYRHDNGRVVQCGCFGGRHIP